MLYIYNCFGGTHSSSMASAIHLGKLPKDRVPSRGEILQTDYFNKLTYDDMGRIIYRGSDEEGNKVYTIGRGPSRVLIPCVRNLITLFQKECGLKEKIILSNMSPTVTLPMTFGGFFSRGLKLDFIGVPLLVAGVKMGYFHMVEIVERTRACGRDTGEQLVVLDNKAAHPKTAMV